MGTPQHTFVAETGQPLQRRRKARLACNPCRARKTGCDGRKPVCSACSLRGWDDKCGYPDSVMQPSAALTLVELDRRLQRLESDARTDPNPNVPRRASPNAAPSVGSSSGPAASVGDDNKEHQAPADPYGSDQPAGTTNMTFMRQGLDVAGPRHSHDSTARSESPASGAESPTFPDLAGFAMQTLEQPLDEIDPHALVLPPRHFADELLRWYWLNFHSIFPFLHWPMFKARYQAVWKEKAASSPTFDDLLFYATLNMVLATACLRNEIIPLDQRHYYGDEFYKRSLRLMSAETLDAASIPIVQLLLLRGVYLYFAGRADRCWLMSGAAIRVAIGLGLHTTPKRQLSQVEREMRRRVWFGGCVSLDQILSTIFGRPGAIYPGLTQTPLPLAIDEEYLSTTEEGRQPDGLPSRMDMINYTVKLLQVVEEMRAAARTPGVKLKPGNQDPFSLPDPSALLSINSKVDDLFTDMPAHLRVDADYSKLPLNEDQVKFFQSQSHALRFRLLLFRVFLLRPSLLAEAQRWATRKSGPVQTAALKFQERLHYEICNLCLETVHKMLEEIHATLATSGGVSAWYALHFTFASATTLLVATLSPRLGVSLETEPTKSSWDRAMGILDFHKSYVVSASRGIDVLLRYRQSITMRSSGSLGLPPTMTQEMADMEVPPSSSYLLQAQQNQQPQQPQQPYPHTQSWDQQHAMPTPPMMGTWMMDGIEFGMEELGDAWLTTTQDWGHQDWVLAHLQGTTGT